MHTVRTNIRLTLMSALLAVMLVLLIVTPVWIFLSGKQIFIQTVLDIAEMPLADRINVTPSSGYLLLALVVLYMPVLIFSYCLWYGIKIVSHVRDGHLLDRVLALRVKKIAIAMTAIGVMLPLCRFLFPVLIYAESEYFQIIIDIGDITCVLIGGLLYVTFQSMLIGIKAKEEVEEFI